jgi:hypothetical protein
VNDSGVVYTIATEVLYFSSQTDFLIQFRDMDGLNPRPSGTVDDSIGAKEMDSTTLASSSASAVYVSTNLDVADDNTNTTSTSSLTYFKMYKE